MFSGLSERLRATDLAGSRCGALIVLALGLLNAVEYENELKREGKYHFAESTVDEAQPGALNDKPVQ